MLSHRVAAVACLVLVLCSFSAAEVLVRDYGVQTGIIGPGAPAHTIGLLRHSQTMTLDTGARTYGVRYVVALDPKRPEIAIPGEGYVGMPEPVDCNWYGGGFFDLQLNGKSIGSTPIQSLTARSSGARGTVDFVFDTPLSLVRIRFVARDGGDCLYTQVLLEPKQTITSVRVATRCYPSGYITDSDRHVQTPTRDLDQGQHADLDLLSEWWSLYYDRVYDAGHVGPTQTGVGPCAMLWLPGQTEKAGFTVGSYGTETTFDLKPALRDFRFVFFDYAGTKNEVARADLRTRAPALVQELASFAFTDPALSGWPVAEKQAQVQRLLATMPEEKATAAQYARWGAELAAQLDLVRSGTTGTIAAEARATQTIGDWERGLPQLRLRALLNKI